MLGFIVWYMAWSLVYIANPVLTVDRDLDLFGSNWTCFIFFMTEVSQEKWFLLRISTFFGLLSLKDAVGRFQCQDRLLLISSSFFGYREKSLLAFLTLRFWILALCHQRRSTSMKCVSILSTFVLIVKRRLGVILLRGLLFNVYYAKSWLDLDFFFRVNCIAVLWAWMACYHSYLKIFVAWQFGLIFACVDTIMWNWFTD